MKTETIAGKFVCITLNNAGRCLIQIFENKAARDHHADCCRWSDATTVIRATGKRGMTIAKLVKQLKTYFADTDRTATEFSVSNAFEATVSVS